MVNNTKKKDICREDDDKILLVEGVNDCHVVMALCKANQVSKGFGIYECGSDDKVLQRLNALITGSESPQIIGIMLDVDSHKHTLASRWQGIKDKLGAYTYDLPSIPNINGTIVEAIEDKPKLGFWFMPNNQDCGMLEDFCVELAEPLSLAFAQECVEQARSQELTTFKDVHFSKAVIHTYLAWQDEPGYPLGQAIGRQSLRPSSNIAIQFTNWLNDLFI